MGSNTGAEVSQNQPLRSAPPPPRIPGTAGEGWASLLGVHVYQGLSWTINISTLVKKAHQCIILLKRSMVSPSPQIVVNF